MGFEGLYPRQAVSAVSPKSKNFQYGTQKGTVKVPFESLEEGVPNQMRTRIFRPIATFISLLLLVAVPVQASPIKFADVVNVMGDLQNGGQLQRLKLRAVAQDPSVSGRRLPKSTTAARCTRLLKAMRNCRHRRSFPGPRPLRLLRLSPELRSHHNSPRATFRCSSRTTSMAPSATAARFRP